MFVRKLKKFRECARDGKIVVTQHAFEEMNDDDLMQIDLENCILNGEIVERQWDNEWSEWKYIINGESTQGEALEVVLKESYENNSVILTTYLL